MCYLLYMSCAHYSTSLFQNKAKTKTKQNQNQKNKAKKINKTIFSLEPKCMCWTSWIVVLLISLAPSLGVSRGSKILKKQWNYRVYNQMVCHAFTYRTTSSNLSQNPFLHRFQVYSINSTWSLRLDFTWYGCRSIQQTLFNDEEFEYDGRWSWGLHWRSCCHVFIYSVSISPKFHWNINMFLW